MIPICISLKCQNNYIQLLNTKQYYTKIFLIITEISIYSTELNRNKKNQLIHGS